MKKTRNTIVFLLAALVCFTGCAQLNGYFSDMYDFFAREASAFEEAWQGSPNADQGGAKSELISQPPEEVEIPGAALLPLQNILQNPELPNGCEATSLTIVLQYLGYDVSKEDMALVYLPREALYYENGVTYGPHPKDCYVGDPSDGTGYYCLAPVIVQGANIYLEENGQRHTASDFSGAREEELVAALAEGTPVVIWHTMDYVDVEYSASSWYLQDEPETEYIPYRNLHCSVLVGYDETYFFLRDPLQEEMQIVEREIFLKAYEALERQAVVLVAQ